MAGLTVMCTLIVDFLYRYFTHTYFSLEKYTFALLFTFISIYYYNRAEEINKEE
jgi:hypothetical protein